MGGPGGGPNATRGVVGGSPGTGGGGRRCTYMYATRRIMYTKRQLEKYKTSAYHFPFDI